MRGAAPWTFALGLFAAPGLGAAAGTAEECVAEVEPAPAFAASVALSDPDATAYMPAVATRGTRALVVWQETSETGSRVVWTLVERGCVAPLRRLQETLPNPRRPAVAATASGWVLAYEARETPEPLIRSLRLDADGVPLGEPETVSRPGRVAARVRVAANGDDVVYAWTEVTRHFVARRGPVEELPPTPAGEPLESAGLVNFPRVGVDEEGTIFLAYRDGGPERTDFEVRLLTRPLGGAFSESLNVSRTRGLMSDDVALTLDPDGEILLVWVEQDGERPDTFEVVHSRRDRSGAWSEPKRFGTLGLASFKPSVTRGLAAAWQAGSVRSGAIYFSDGGSEPVRIVPEYTGGMVSLARDERDDLHLAFVETGGASRLRYAWRSPPVNGAVPAAGHR